MGIRLEFILLIIIIITLMVTIMSKLTDTSMSHKKMYKELEFKDTIFIEVNQNTTRSKLFSTHGVRDTGILTLKNIKYYTNNIKELLADKGVYKNHTLYLDGHVKLTEKDGAIYTAEHANYEKKKEVLNITSPFKAHMGKNIIYGDSLIYFVKEKVVKAKAIDATIYTVEK